jgi:MoaA/NifB/PqqE/SkfB family radical SAM enzyme
MNDLDRMSQGAREQRLVDALDRGPLSVGELRDVALPFFVKLQIQTQSYCNAACVTCPYPETSATQSMGRMTQELFELIVEQLRHRGVERTSLFLMNEPMVDRRLESFTALLKARVPETCATIITNGTLLDRGRAVALAAAGMDEISVSVNGFDADSYQQNMVGLRFERILANLIEVGAAARAGELGGLDVRVVALDIGDARDQAAAFAERVGLPVYLKPVTNRAGSVDTSALVGTGAAPRREKHMRPCQRPFVKAYILFDGTMVLCNCDWNRTTVLGNVAETPLQELWQHPTLEAIRRQHAARQLPAGSLCAGCDYPYLI